jgi:hypothetical protein
MSKPLTDFQRRVVLDKYEPDSDVVGMALVAALDRLDFLERKLEQAEDMAIALEAISPMLPRSLSTSAHGDPVWTTAIRKVESALAAWDAVPGMEP